MSIELAAVLSLCGINIFVSLVCLNRGGKMRLKNRTIAYLESDLSRANANANRNAELYIRAKDKADNATRLFDRVSSDYKITFDSLGLREKEVIRLKDENRTLALAREEDLATIPRLRSERDASLERLRESSVRIIETERAAAITAEAFELCKVELEQQRVRATHLLRGLQQLAQSAKECVNADPVGGVSGALGAVGSVGVANGYSENYAESIVAASFPGKELTLPHGVACIGADFAKDDDKDFTAFVTRGADGVIRRLEKV